MSKRHYKTRSSFVVVSINPDGTVDAVFNCAADAAKLYDVTPGTVNRYCRTGAIGQGKRWFYEEKFREIYMACEMDKLRFTLPADYVPKRRCFYKGHTKGNGWSKRSEESKEKTRRIASRIAKAINKDGRNRLGGCKKGKTVVCLTDGKEFPSIRCAADHYGIPRSSVHYCAHRIGITHNLKFRFKSQLENIKEIV